MEASPASNQRTKPSLRKPLARPPEPLETRPRFQQTATYISWPQHTAAGPVGLIPQTATTVCRREHQPLLARTIARGAPSAPALASLDARPHTRASERASEAACGAFSAVENVSSGSRTYRATSQRSRSNRAGTAGSVRSLLYQAAGERAGRPGDVAEAAGGLRGLWAGCGSAGRRSWADAHAMRGKRPPRARGLMFSSGLLEIA